LKDHHLSTGSVKCKILDKQRLEVNLCLHLIPINLPLGDGCNITNGVTII